MTQVKLVTIEQARTVLGEKGKRMTDEQINDLLQLLRVISDKSIKATVDIDD